MNDVEADAVARREGDRLAVVAGKPRGQGARVLEIECEALAQLNRSAVVRGSDEKQRHVQKCESGTAPTRTATTSRKPATARYAARRPRQPAS